MVYFHDQSHVVQSWTEQCYPKKMFASLFKELLGKHVALLMSLESLNGIVSCLKVLTGDSDLFHLDLSTKTSEERCFWSCGAGSQARTYMN